jgi:diguanylate cyclase (GGDEF)-like protein
MNLDPATLGTVSILLSALMGGLLLFAWLQNRTMTALSWWGVGFFVGALGVGILGFQKLVPHVSDEAVAIGNALIAAGIGSKYCGCRAFNGRPPRIALGLAGAVLWLAAWPLIHDSPEARLTFIGLTASTYLALSAWELVRHAPQRLVSQHAVVAVYGAAALSCMARGMVGPSLQTGFWAELFGRGWTAEWALLVLLYIPTIAFLLLSMAKERLEYVSRQSALTDPLTLLPNRRCFFQQAEALASRHRTTPVSCLLFDLDSFKRINDVYGHPVGDHVLQVFAGILVKHLPEGASGRLGGEEFAALIQENQQEALALAEQIRKGLAHSSITLGDLQVRVTVSVGCATAIGQPVAELLTRADQALYEAKACGRNIVVCANGKRQVRIQPDHLVGRR